LQFLRTKVMKFTKPKSEPARFGAICNTYLSNAAAGFFLRGMMEVQGKARCHWFYQNNGPHKAMMERDETRCSLSFLCVIKRNKKTLKENMNPKTLDAHSHSFIHSLWLIIRSYFSKFYRTFARHKICSP
jgi:hypothetical protein